MRKLPAILILVYVNAVFGFLRFAQAGEIITDQYSTADNSLQLNTDIQVSMLEIGFKSSPDFLKFRVDGSQQKLNLKGLVFFDDKDFKTVSNDYIVHQGDIITLYFDSAKNDQASEHNLFTEKKGLTGTTEQILIHSGTRQLDFFCWYKNPPASAEITDFAKIWNERLWEDNDISSCLDSETVKNGDILERKNSQPNSTGWSVKNSASPTATGESPKTITKENLISLIENAGESTGFPQLQITEIYPNPVSKEENEWIEIQNSSDSPVNLTGWIIDDENGGSKPHRLDPLRIPSQELTVIKPKDYGINLNNDGDSVRLFMPDGSLAVEQSYSGGKKGQSYALTILDGSETWSWSDHPGPGRLTPILQTVRGIIAGPAEFGNIYHFALRDDLQNLLLVQFSEDVIKAPLAKEIFAAGSQGDFTGEISTAPENPAGYRSILQLHNYEITSLSQNSSSSPYLLFAVIIVVLITAIYFSYSQFRKWKPSLSPSSVLPS